MSLPQVVLIPNEFGDLDVVDLAQLLALDEAEDWAEAAIDTVELRRAPEVREHALRVLAFARSGDSGAYWGGV